MSDLDCDSECIDFLISSICLATSNPLLEEEDSDFEELSYLGDKSYLN